jgi:AraC family transcriptional regulator
MEGSGAFDYLAAVEVPSDVGLPGELADLRIPPAHYAVFAHREHISAIGKTWMAIFKDWPPNSGREIARALQFELYSETFNPQNALGGVDIWIPLKS